MRLILLLLFPIFLQAQIQRAYGVIEIANFPTSSATGPKFAYRPADSSFYRWVSGSTWLKIIPDEPDTLYLKQLSGTTALVDGDTINTSTYLLKADTASMLAAYVKLVGYGLIKTGQTIRVDTTSPNGLATRKYALLNPTAIAANYAAISNGTNLIARNFFNSTAYAGVIGVPWKFGEWTTAGRPTGVLGYTGFNTTLGYQEFYDGTQYLPVGFWEKTGNDIVYNNTNGRILAKRYGYSYTTSPAYTFSDDNDTGMSGDPDGIKLIHNGVKVVDARIDGIYLRQINPLLNNTYNLGQYDFRWATIYATRFAPLVGSASAPPYQFQDGFANLFNAGMFGLGTFTNNSLGFSTNGTEKMRITNNGGVLIGTTTENTNVLLNLQSTAKVFLPPVMTAAQLSAITVPTGGLAYQSNSTEGLYLKTSSALKKILVDGDDTWLGTRLNAANVDINANGNQFRIDSLSEFLISAPSTSTLGGAGIEQIKWLNTARTKYYNRRLHYDSRALISGGMPAFYNLLTTNKGSGEGYEWANEMIWDTTNNVFIYGYGGRYDYGYLKFNGRRSNTAGVYLSVPRFHFFGTNVAENATNDTYHTMWGETGLVADMMMGLKDGGKFLIASDSTFIFDPTTDVLQLNKMGQGNKEAPDLSLGTPTYIAAFAPSGTGQGTVLDFRLSRDTFIENVTLFSVGTLLNTCQELTVVSSMTVLAGSDQEIRFPDAVETLRGRKIIVYSKKKDTGLYVPKIKVVGGISKLFFTTNSAVGGTDPSDQSELAIDDTTWSDHGTTFEFTCLKISSTDYRWVLKQR